MFLECRHCNNLNWDRKREVYVCSAYDDKEVNPSDDANWCPNRNINSSWGFDRTEELERENRSW